jgi:repressor LexA
MGSGEERRQKILAFLRLCERNDAHPTVREIGFAVGLLSPSTVKVHLDYLEELGQIEHSPNTSRSFRIKRTNYMTCPTCSGLGKVPMR